ncbi:MAG: DUF222 domain-containing protein [Actinomycetota bacterium]
MEFAAPRTSGQLANALDRAAALMVAASAEALRVVAAFDERGLWKRDGATSMSSWLAGRYGLAWGTAREWVRVAHALRRLPQISDAYASGRLSWDQLRPLTRFATPETDRCWADRAPRLRPWTLHREAARHDREARARGEEARRLRSLSFHWDPDLPLLYLEATLPGEEGAAVQGALEQRAQEVVLADRPEAPQEARLADALVELVTGGPQGEAPPSTLVVHAGAEVLAAEESAIGPVVAETEDGRGLPTEAVRRLACDGRIEWVLESGGRPVGVGRRGRAVPGYLGRLLRHRDGACRFPGCERRRWLKAHHLVHWASGGGTDLDNLVLLCHAHHRLLHEGGWRTSGHPARNLRFHDPGGRPLRTMPPELAPRIRERLLT